MSIDTGTAARIGRKHRLTLADVRALAQLADTAEDAERLARDFTDTPDAGSVDSIEALAQMSPQQIVAAKAAGRIDMAAVAESYRDGPNVRSRRLGQRAAKEGTDS